MTDRPVEPWPPLRCAAIWIGASIVLWLGILSVVVP